MSRVMSVALVAVWCMLAAGAAWAWFGAPWPSPRPPTAGASSLPHAAPTCVPRSSGGDWLPDPVCTPGAVNPRVTQGNIGSTICRPGWATAERARYFPLSKSEPAKRLVVRAYGQYAGASLRGYEADHLVPLSSGGSPDDPKNLWPESPATPNRKDKVEAAANRAVCAGRMTLAHVQAGFEKDWRGLAGELGADSGG